MDAEPADTLHTACATAERRVLLLFCITELLLIAATRNVWFDASPFPRIPLIRQAGWLPDSAVAAVSAAFVAALVLGSAVAFRRRCGRRTGVLPAAVLAVLGTLPVLCSQQCLQAWHWLFLLAMITRLTAGRIGWLPVLRHLMAGIYLFSALSRVGPEFDSGMTRSIVMSLLDLARLPLLADDARLVSWLCGAASTAEFATGMALLSRRTRRFLGLPLAVTMHTLLLAALGPWGLNHEAGVLIWNIMLAVTAVTVFGPRNQPPRLPDLRSRMTAAAVILWPALALVGITDNWTGWQLYSPRPETLRLEVHVEAIGQLPPSLQKFVRPPLPLQDWCSVRMDRWCLEATGAPICPQARFQLAVALAVTQTIEKDEYVRAVLNAPQRPWWWKRHVRTWTGRKELLRAADTFPLYQPAAERSPSAALRLREKSLHAIRSFFSPGENAPIHAVRFHVLGFH